MMIMMTGDDGDYDDWWLWWLVIMKTGDDDDDDDHRGKLDGLDPVQVDTGEDEVELFVVIHSDPPSLQVLIVGCRPERHFRLYSWVCCQPPPLNPFIRIQSLEKNTTQFTDGIMR